MATDRQIEANRRNATLSRGPTTADGKAISRLNAVKHGLAAKSVEAVRSSSETFDARLEAWRGEVGPTTPLGRFAIERTVAASIRMERCDAAIEALHADTARRAEHSWEIDRRAEAAAGFRKLDADPTGVVASLKRSPQGVDLLIEAWTALALTLDSDGAWNPGQRHQALNLLGVPRSSRSASTLIELSPLERGEGVTETDQMREIAFEEIRRLGQDRDEALRPVDELARAQARAGLTALLTRTGATLMGYARAARRDFYRSLGEARAFAAEGEGDGEGDAGGDGEATRSTPHPLHSPAPFANRPIQPEAITGTVGAPIGGLVPSPTLDPSIGREDEIRESRTELQEANRRHFLMAKAAFEAQLAARLAALKDEEAEAEAEARERSTAGLGGTAPRFEPSRGPNRHQRRAMARQAGRS